MVEENIKIENKTLPLVTRVFLGVSGWISSGFLLAFILFFTDILDTPVNALALGLILSILTFLVYKKELKNIFFSQLILTMNLLGQGLIIFFLTDLSDYDETILLFLVAFFQLVVFLVFRNFPLKILSVIVGGISLFFGLSMMTYGGYFFYPTLFLCLVFVWIYGKKNMPLAWGLTLLSIITIFLTPLLEYFDISLDGGLLWIMTPLYLLGILLLAKNILKSINLWGIMGVILFTVTTLWAPGLETVISLIILGIYLKKNDLLSLGVISTVGFISVYYYRMDVTLFQKSLSLIIMGTVLLLIRFVLKKKGYIK